MKVMMLHVVDSHVHGFHVYHKDIWTPTTVEVLSCKRGLAALDGPFSVAACQLFWCVTVSYISHDSGIYYIKLYQVELYLKP